MLAVTLGTLLLSGVSANGQESLQRPKLSSVSHLSVYSTDAVKTEHFYVHDLGATEGVDPQDPAGVRYYFNAVQFIEVLPLPADEQDPKNRFHGVGYNTANAEAMRRYLDAHNIVVANCGYQGHGWQCLLCGEGSGRKPD